MGDAVGDADGDRVRFSGCPSDMHDIGSNRIKSDFDSKRSGSRQLEYDFMRH